MIDTTDMIRDALAEVIGNRAWEEEMEASDLGDEEVNEIVGELCAATDRLRELVLAVHRLAGRPARPVAIAIDGILVVVAGHPAYPDHEPLLTIVDPADVATIRPLTQGG